MNSNEQKFELKIAGPSSSGADSRWWMLTINIFGSCVKALQKVIARLAKCISTNNQIETIHNTPRWNTF